MHTSRMSRREQQSELICHWHDDLHSHHTTDEL